MDTQIETHTLATFTGLGLTLETVDGTYRVWLPGCQRGWSQNQNDTKTETVDTWTEIDGEAFPVSTLSASLADIMRIASGVQTQRAELIAAKSYLEGLELRAPSGHLSGHGRDFAAFNIKVRTSPENLPSEDLASAGTYHGVHSSQSVPSLCPGMGLVSWGATWIRDLSGYNYTAYADTESAIRDQAWYCAREYVRELGHGLELECQGRSGGWAVLPGIEVSELLDSISEALEPTGDCHSVFTPDEALALVAAFRQIEQYLASVCEAHPYTVAVELAYLFSERYATYQKELADAKKATDIETARVELRNACWDQIHAPSDGGIQGYRSTKRITLALQALDAIDPLKTPKIS